ncbi:MATE family efflux transporter [Brevibacillus humidisoli]|uniref:MATE family efflux transporter n=1 Tax=Brevibacillus humidisoli TaxID=2895522 RepID=UPI001E3AEE95|nr:MATE family efflux transporter [Brevibacillus humidisoli]UFJ40502.1 MATE family efflux transporter [Brevibacillus humidisoli]
MDRQYTSAKSVKTLRLFALTWPILVELFLHMMMGSVDTFMLSHVSDEAVAAVGVANQLVTFTILLFGFVATGASVTISQYLGARKPLEANRIAGISLTANLLFGIFVSLLVIMFRGHFLQLFSLADEVRQLADLYLLIVGGSLFTQALLLTVSAILRANGNTRDAMLVSLAMNVIHVVGNYLFIFGAWGVPQLGVPGVAISTAVSRAIALVFIVIVLYRSLVVPIRWSDYIEVKWKYLKQIFRIGIPSAGEALSYHTSQIAITAFIALLGTAALTTRIYAINLMSFILLFGMALGQGTQVLIGHMVGAKENERAYRQLLKSLRISLMVTASVAVIVAICREPLFSIFTEDPQIISMGSTLLLLCLLLEPGRTFNLVVISSLRAAGDASFPVFIGILSMWGISVPLSYLLGISLELGLPGVWIALTIDEWFRGICMYYRWKSRVWERKVLVSEGV